jgi:hypothetical protein
MMKSHSVYKTTTLGGQLNNKGAIVMPEYIKGTQVTKDFQLVAEPLLPKINNHMQSQSIMNSSNGYTPNTGTHP